MSNIISTEIAGKEIVSNIENLLLFILYDPEFHNKSELGCCTWNSSLVLS